MNFSTRLNKIFLLVSITAICSFATDYMITWINPPSKIDTSTNVRIDFIKQNLLADDSVTVYYGTQTGGGIPANYPLKASFVFATGNPSIESDSAIDSVAQYRRSRVSLFSDGASYDLADTDGLSRSIYISPRFQTGNGGTKPMLAGRFYFIVKGKRSGVSQEAQLIVETRQAAEITSPRGNITSMLPIFSWTPVPGVPYYHLLLSDQPIQVSEEGLSDASFIWQAIVPGSEIQYGSPDPSGLFPIPPPLSPGTTYQWLVLNNYGNQKEYTSINAVPIPADFTVQGSLAGLDAPDTSTMKTVGDGRSLTCAYDSVGALVAVDTFYAGESDSGRLSLSWGKVVHDDFNLYRVYLYNVVFDSSTNSDAAVAVWTRSTTDTFVNIDAKSFLADSVLHVWKVFAENTSGAGVASEKQAFFYNDTAPKATIRYRSYERVGTSDSVVLKFANVTITPLSGGGLPIDIPTDINGYGRKTVQYGTYRVLMNPAGFMPESKDVVMSQDNYDVTLTFVLTPYPAQLFGTVADSGTPIGDAVVEAVGTQGDTIRTNTDASGSFSLFVNSGDWLLTASKLGFQRSSPPLPFSLSHGQTSNTGTINISRFTNLISGTVRNSVNNSPIINALVTLKRNGIQVGEQRTSDVGSYSFAVEPGTGYAVTVVKQGFTSATRSGITLTTNIVFDAYLSSATGSVSGKAFVTANIVSATVDSFVTNGRQGIVITAINSNGDTAAVTESSRGDNTFLLTLEPGTYTIHGTGRDIVPDSISNIVVIENTTVDTSIRLTEFGRITGKMFARSGGINSIVNVTARGSVGQERTAQASQTSGEYSVTGLSEGSWTLVFSKNGFVTDSATASIAYVNRPLGVRALSSEYLPEDSLSPGTHSLTFTMSLIDSSIPYDSRQTIKVVSPSPQNIVYGDTLKQLGAGTYVLGTTVNPLAVTTNSATRILGIDSLGVAVTGNANVSLVHPFRHNTIATASVTNDTATLFLLVKSTGYTVASVDSSATRLFYRDQSSNVWLSTTLSSRRNDTLVFKVIVPNDNSSMVYYFDVKAATGSGNAWWSNRFSPYSTFIPAGTGIKYVTIFPTSFDASTPASIPWRTSTEFTVLCQDGSFTPRTPASVTWSAVNRTGIVTFSGLNTSTLSATVGSDTSISESYVDTILCTVRIGSRDTVVKTYYRIIKQSVDMLVITGSASSITSGSKASFLVAGLNTETGRVFPTRAVWAPSEFINSLGEFTAPANFIGTVKIRAEAFGKRAFMDLPVKHIIKANDTSFAFDAQTVTEAGIILNFSSRVYPSGSGRDITLRTTAATEVPVLKAITSVGEVVSPLFKLSLGNVSAAMPSDSFSIIMKIPAESRGKQIFPAVWNQRRTTWIPLGDTSTVFLDISRNIVARASALATPAGAAYVKVSLLNLGEPGGSGISGEYALLHPSDNFGISALRLGPNPFSPLVLATDSVGNRWQGLRIEFFVNSDKSPQSYSEVQILNMEGNVINNVMLTYQETIDGFKELYSLNKKGGFYGRKTLKRVYTWNGTTSSGRMCRNGRYLVRIMASDGISTEYKTVPVTLFK